MSDSNRKYAKCDCGVEMTPNNSGCTVTHVRYHGKNYARIPNFGSACGDCNCASETLHHIGCDGESCPVCGGQLLGCDCNITTYLTPGPKKPKLTFDGMTKDRKEIGRYTKNAFFQALIKAHPVATLIKIEYNAVTYIFLKKPDGHADLSKLVGAYKKKTETGYIYEA